MNRKIVRATAWSLALGLATLTGAARADEKEPKTVEKRVVLVDKDGKRQVFEGDGLLMRRGYLGLSLTELTPELRAHFGVPQESGVMVSKVEPGSPAEKAGIRVGDILTSVDGQDVKSSWDVMTKVRQLEEGQQVPAEIWRNGKAQNVTATIVEKERPELDVAPFFFRKGDEGPIRIHVDPDKIREGTLLGLPAERIERHGEERGRKAVPGRFVTPREMELEKKLKELEKRIDELQRQLEKKN